MKPSNLSAVLLHCKALLMIVASLEERIFEEQLSGSRRCGNAGDSANADSRVYPPTFDSPFHLDITIRDMGLSFQGSSDDILSNAPVEDLVYSVAIYCNSRTYPRERCLQQMPNHMSVR